VKTLWSIHTAPHVFTSISINESPTRPFRPGIALHTRKVFVCYDLSTGEKGKVSESCQLSLSVIVTLLSYCSVASSSFPFMLSVFRKANALQNDLKNLILLRRSRENSMLKF